MKQKKAQATQTPKRRFNLLRNFIKKFTIERSSLFLIIIVLLSVTDAFFTLFWIKKGWATEANPMLSGLLAYGDRWFLGVKIGFTYFGCTILYLVKDKKLVTRSIKIILTLYIFLTMYHLFGVLASIEFSFDQLQHIFSEFCTLFLSF
tara:strand:- start:103 stop:546 length:444 start_codon:yes stop_codon:yes gene_type:complete